MQTIIENGSTELDNVSLANNEAPMLTSDVTDASVSDLPTEPTPAPIKAPPSRRRVVIGKTGGATIKRVAGRTVAVKPQAPAIVKRNTPPDAEKLAARDAQLGERADARRAAAVAVAAFYSGKSLPFKSAFDLRRKSAINHALTRDPSARTAGLIAAIITYCDVQPDGTFVRGSGRVPGSLLGYTGDDAKRIFNAGPESGCLSNCLPDRIAYVNGAIHGAGCELASFKLDFAACEANMRAHNDTDANGKRVFAAPLRLLAAIQRKAGASAS